MLDPVLLIGLTWLASRSTDMDADTPASVRWHMRLEMIAGMATDGNMAVELHHELSPDVTLMDLQMPGLDGVGAIEAIKARQPSAYILILTTYDSDADILRAIEAGATGYLLKDAPRDELFRAIRAAAAG